MSDSAGFVKGGRNKGDGNHDHRSNTGGDRTPAQKDADKNKKK